jgi:predicted transcriptional regulator
MTKPAQTDPEIAAKRAAILKGIASADAGKVIPYEDVRRWLLSWGTKDDLPPPECP